MSPLVSLLRTVAAEKWCLKIPCTTCGNEQVRRAISNDLTVLLEDLFKSSVRRYMIELESLGVTGLLFFFHLAVEERLSRLIGEDANAEEVERVVRLWTGARRALDPSDVTRAAFEYSLGRIDTAIQELDRVPQLLVHFFYQKADARAFRGSLRRQLHSMVERARLSEHRSAGHQERAIVGSF